MPRNPLTLLCLLSALTPGVKADDPFAAPAEASAVLTQYCVACHGPDKHKGDVRVDALASLTDDARLDLLNAMQKAIRLKEMPPDDKPQPTDAQRQMLDGWIGGVLRSAHAAKFEAKMQKPEYGNFVDHDKLFSGQYKDLPGFTYDRRWLISEYIFDAKFQRILQERATTKRQGKNVPIVGSHRFTKLSLTNPFLLPSQSGVRYYADTDLTGGHLSSMLTDAQKVAEYITDELVQPKKNNNYLPAIGQIMALENRHNATLAARREFLESSIARVCEECYGAENEAMLPKFVPVVLKEGKPLGEGETYKKAPFHVAQNSLKGLKGEQVLFGALLDPQHRGKSDDQIRDLCERTWFFFGDHERTIQGRMALLRDYLPEFRKHVADNGKKLKVAVGKSPDAAELKVIHASVRELRRPGDHYADLINKCMTGWERQFHQARIDAGPPSDKLLSDLIVQLFVQVLERPPTGTEAAEYLAVSRTYVKELGNLKAIQKLIQTLILTSEFVYRQEFGVGQPDQYGRRMLAPRDASYAIAYALTDQGPDAELVEAARAGKLSTREDYRREVTRILKKRDVPYLISKVLEDKHFADNTTHTAIRKLRFFREFFGYPAAIEVFKDEKRFGAERLDFATARLLSEADRVVDSILDKDKDVFEELLTTDKFYVYHDGDNQRMQAASDRIKRIYAHFKDLDWKHFKNEDLLKHREFLKEVKMRSVDPDNLEARNRQGTTLQLFKKSMTTITARLDKGQKEAAPFDLYRGYGHDFMEGYNVAKFFNYSLDNWDYQTVQPAPVPNRKGMLTHPAWLIAHAKNTETDPVSRGKWIREKLLAGTVPDVPITVDAVIPEDHNRTLRARLASATETEYCWKCHKQMNPLGYAFEQFDDFGRYRKLEPLEYPEHLLKRGPDDGDHLTDRRDTYKTAPIDSKGYLAGTGEASLDGQVKDALDLVDRLAKSRRVRQSILRYAFRYFMGRNETLSDSKTLIDAEQAYVSGGGSFDAVIVSLLTSDSFIYRKPIAE